METMLSQDLARSQRENRNLSCIQHMSISPHCRAFSPQDYGAYLNPSTPSKTATSPLSALAFCLLKYQLKQLVFTIYKNCIPIVAHIPAKYCGASWLRKIELPQMPPIAPAEIIAAATIPFFSNLAV